MFEYFPKEWKEAANKMEKPVFQMLQAMYGHPLSGQIFVRQLLLTLRFLGWQESPVDPAVLLWQQGEMEGSIAVYVDDVFAEGDEGVLDLLWKRLATFFVFGKPELADLVLGSKLSYFEIKTDLIIEITMTDYAMLTVQTYEKEKGKPVKLHDTPTTFDPRLEKRDDFGPPIHIGFIQKIVGMLLWLARNCRSEIAFAVSMLGSRVLSWSERCETQLEVAVGYLKKHPDLGLRLTKSKLDAMNDLSNEVHGDADWSLPKSQTGFHNHIVGPAGAHMPIDWASKKQSVVADSTCAAETCALHHSVRESLLASEVIFGGFRKLIAYTDNNACLRAANRGSSSPLMAFQRVIGLKNGFLRDLVSGGFLEIRKIAGTLCKGNIFTKVLPRMLFEREREMIGIYPALSSSSTEVTVGSAKLASTGKEGRTGQRSSLNVNGIELISADRMLREPKGFVSKVISLLPRNEGECVNNNGDSLLVPFTSKITCKSTPSIEGCRIGKYAVVNVDVDMGVTDECSMSLFWD